MPSWILSSSDSSEEEGATYSNPDSSCSDEEEVFSVSQATLPSGNRIVNMGELQKIFSAVAVCKACSSGELTIRETSREGLVSFVTLDCSNCGTVGENFALGNKTPQCKFYDFNRRSVLAMRRVGRGHASLKKICGVMDLAPPVSESNYRRHQRALRDAAVTVAEMSMRKAAEELRQLSVDPDQYDEAQPASVAVTYDGTWMRRGFSSLYGVFSCIAWNTGRIVDIAVCSKFCQACNMKKNEREQKKITAAEFAEWKEEHQGTCSANSTCSSPAMESRAAVSIWTDSVESRGLMYTTYIGDGDSKGYSAVTQEDPYGPNHPVTKEECIGHVQKRVGTGLRKLKKDLKGKKLSDDKPIGGVGRLTDRLIDMLQTYYGMAIRENSGDVQGMARAIWAGLMHRVSTDDKPQHHFCPTGPTSWCGFQRVQAGAEEVYEHHNTLPMAVFEVIKPLYLRLASKDLLERCLRGATQNRNECYNGLVWAMCPKEQFCGLDVVETAASLAVLQFNNGAVAISKILQHMGCVSGSFTEAQLATEDEIRIRKSKKKETMEEKSRRKQRRRWRKGVEERQLDEEGATYAAGDF